MRRRCDRVSLGEEKDMSEPTKIELEVARVIDPAAIRKYEKAVSEGRTAANGRPWADVAYGADRDIAIQQARAAIAIVHAHDRAGVGMVETV